MEIKFNNFKPSGKIDIPCSKSYAHRALIAAFIIFLLAKKSKKEEA
jgi:5-enolpyruvylshikimate-3-phosphate synthase